MWLVWSVILVLAVLGYGAALGISTLEEFLIVLPMTISVIHIAMMWVEYVGLHLDPIIPEIAMEEGLGIYDRETGDQIPRSTADCGVWICGEGSRAELMAHRISKNFESVHNHATYCQIPRNGRSIRICGKRDMDTNNQDEIYSHTMILPRLVCSKCCMHSKNSSTEFQVTNSNRTNLAPPRNDKAHHNKGLEKPNQFGLGEHDCSYMEDVPWCNPGISSHQLERLKRSLESSDPNRLKIKDRGFKWDTSHS